MKFSLGLLPPTPEGRLRANRFDELPVKGTSLIGFADMSPFVGPDRDQNGVGSCASHAVLLAARGTLARKGALPFEPSPKAVYADTLATLRADQHPGLSAADLVRLYPLQDGGSMLLDVVVTLAQWGIRPIGPLGMFDCQVVQSDCVPDNFADEPDLGGLEQSRQKLIIGAHALTSLDEDMAALESGVMLADGGFVDSAFEEWDGGSRPITAPNMGDQNGGGHATRRLGYWWDSGTRLWLGANTWYPWGRPHSLFIADDAWVRSRWERYALDAEVSS